MVTDFSLVTPGAALRSFQSALAADSPQFEWKSLSDRLKRENDLDYQRYVVGRRVFLRRNREAVRRFLEARVARVDHGRLIDGAQVARMILTDGEWTAELELINQAYWEISLKSPPGEPEESMGAPFGDVSDLIEHLAVEGDQLVVRIPLVDLPPVEPGTIAGVELKNEWKVLKFLRIEDTLQDLEEDGKPSP